MGPIDVAVLEFRGNQFTGEIAPALADVVKRGIVRIIDLLVVTKDDGGTVGALELDMLDPAVAQGIDAVTDEIMGLLSEDDVERIGARLAPNSTAAIIVFENVWAAGLKAAIANANGRLVGQWRIPAEVVDQALASATVAAG